jgi:carbonic anhydrase
MSTLQYAIEHLKVDHVIVMGHTKCGGIKAAIACESLGLIDQWLQHIREVAVKHRKELDNISDEKEFEQKLTELNVREQALNVYKLSWVQKAMIERKVQIHGWICDIETGLIKELALSNDDWDEIESYFKYDF